MIYPTGRKQRNGNSCEGTEALKTQESRTSEDTEGPCSQGRNGDIKQFLLLPPTAQKLSCPPHRRDGVKGQPTGGVVCAVPGHEHACVRRR